MAAVINGQQPFDKNLFLLCERKAFDFRRDKESFQGSYFAEASVSSSL